MSSQPGTTAWLAKHPEILIGRDALDKARDGVADPGNTFEIITKPLSDVVLYQQYDADTRERLWVVALVGDEKAESYYAERHEANAHRGGKHENCKECEEAKNEGPDGHLFATAPKKLKGL